MGFFSKLFARSSGQRSSLPKATADEFGHVLQNAAMDIASSIDRALTSLDAFKAQPEIHYSRTFTVEVMIYAMAPLDFILTTGLTKLPPATASRVRAGMHRALIETLLREAPGSRTEEQWLRHITDRFDRYCFVFGSGDIFGVGGLAATAIGVPTHPLTQMALHDSFLNAVEIYPSLINAANIVD